MPFYSALPLPAPSKLRSGRSASQDMTDEELLAAAEAELAEHPEALEELLGEFDGDTVSNASSSKSKTSSVGPADSNTATSTRRPSAGTNGAVVEKSATQNKPSAASQSTSATKAGGEGASERGRAQTWDSSKEEPAARRAAAAQRAMAGNSLAYLINHEGADGGSNGKLRETGTTVDQGGQVHVASIHGQRQATLYQLKGRRRIVTVRVPITANALGDGDAFVLDAVDTIYVWLGAESNRMEQAQARALGIFINDNEGGRRAKIVTVDRRTNGEGPAAAEMNARLLHLAGELDDSSEEPVLTLRPAAADEEESDTQFERRFLQETVLFQVATDGAAQEVAVGQTLRRELLSTDSVYVLLSMGELFIWAGRRATAEQLQAAQAFAQRLSNKKETVSVPYPIWPVVELRQGVETSGFTVKFAQWEATPDITVQVQTSAPPLESQAFRVRALTSSGVLPARPAAFENVKPTVDPHARVERQLYSVAEVCVLCTEKGMGWCEGQFSFFFFLKQFSFCCWLAVEGGSGGRQIPGWSRARKLGVAPQ